MHGDVLGTVGDDLEEEGPVGGGNRTAEVGFALDGKCWQPKPSRHLDQRPSVWRRERGLEP